MYSVAAVKLLELLEEIALTALLPRWRCDVPGLYRVMEKRAAAQ